MFTTSTIQRVFKRSPQTIRNWAEEFQLYLSDAARPRKGKRRVFNFDDVTVFSLVHDMSHRGFDYTEIGLALKNGQRGELPQELVDEDALQLVDLSPEEIARTLTLINERNELKGQVKTLLVEGEKKDEEIKRLNEIINQNNREIGKMEALIELYKDQLRSDKNDG